MIVVLDILRGGSFLVIFSSLLNHFDVRNDQTVHGLEWLMVSFMASALPITAWFWVRLASVGEVGFASTPGGTSFAFFCHVSGETLKSAAGVLAFLVLWLFSTPIFGLVLYFVTKIPVLRKIEVLVPALTPFFVLGVVFFAFSKSLLFLLSQLRTYCFPQSALDRSNWRFLFDL